MTEPILTIEGLKKHYSPHSGPAAKLFGPPPRPILAVDGVDLVLGKGETLGLVGESGCGKSTLGRTTLLLERPTCGKIVFEQTDLTELDARKLRLMRRRMQMVFQDPAASLNPRKTVRSILGVPIRMTGAWDRQDGVRQLLELVGLSEDSLGRYPHQFSGGQKQRIGIARALASRPAIIIADEPVASLDVSMQAQILRLLRELQGEFGLSYIIISHDLNVVRLMSDRVAVMYLGKIIENGCAEDVVRSPIHPYTQALISAIPDVHAKRKRIVLSGEVPDPSDPPRGCRFHPRCFMQKVCECTEVEPPLVEIGGGRLVSCHLASR